MYYNSKGKKVIMSTPFQRSDKVPYEKRDFTPPKKNSNISSKELASKIDVENNQGQKKLYLFG